MSRKILVACDKCGQSIGEVTNNIYPNVGTITLNGHGVQQRTYDLCRTCFQEVMGIVLRPILGDGHEEKIP